MVSSPKKWRYITVPKQILFDDIFHIINRPEFAMEDMDGIARTEVEMYDARKMGTDDEWSLQSVRSTLFEKAYPVAD